MRRWKVMARKKKAKGRKERTMKERKEKAKARKERAMKARKARKVMSKRVPILDANASVKARCMSLVRYMPAANARNGSSSLVCLFFFVFSSRWAEFFFCGS